MNRKDIYKGIVAIIGLGILLGAVYFFAAKPDQYAAAILACYPENTNGSAYQPVPNNSVQQVKETSRMFIKMPKDLYPKDILHSWTTVAGNATALYISNGGLPGEGLDATPGCWSTYFEFDGNGEVDLRVKSIASDAPDYFVRFIVSQNPPALTSSEATSVQQIIKDTNSSTPAPAGYQVFKDTKYNVTFNAPADWKPHTLPEGDGTLSMVSPDLSDPLGSMKGAYIHYSLEEPSGSFENNPDGLMASLKQGMVWSDTALDGHPAFITKNDNGYTMIVSKFSNNLVVTISFVDPDKKYREAFDEFIKTFHVL
jgi:hypothetical protein